MAQVVYPDIVVGGSLEGGLIISAGRPPQFNSKAPQYLTITPIQSRSLMAQLNGKLVQELRVVLERWPEGAVVLLDKLEGK